MSALSFMTSEMRVLLANTGLSNAQVMDTKKEVDMPVICNNIIQSGARLLRVLLKRLKGGY